MPRFVLARLALIPPMLLGVSLLVFVMLRVGPGDPALDYLRLSQVPPTDAALADARSMLGLDRPFAASTSTGCGGRSRAFRPLLRHPPASAAGTPRLPAGDARTRRDGARRQPSLELAARRLGGGASRRLAGPAGAGIAVLGVSLPNFWVAFLLVVVFSVTLGWLPAMGRGGAAHLAMPALAIA